MEYQITTTSIKFQQKCYATNFTNTPGPEEACPEPLMSNRAGTFFNHLRDPQTSHKLLAKTPSKGEYPQSLGLQEDLELYGNGVDQTINGFMRAITD